HHDRCALQPGEVLPRTGNPPSGHLHLPRRGLLPAPRPGADRPVAKGVLAQCSRTHPDPGSPTLGAVPGRGRSGGLRVPGGERPGFAQRVTTAPFSIPTSTSGSGCSAGPCCTEPSWKANCDPRQGHSNCFFSASI